MRLGAACGRRTLGALRSTEPDEATTVTVARGGDRLERDVVIGAEG